MLDDIRQSIGSPAISDQHRHSDSLRITSFGKTPWFAHEIDKEVVNPELLKNQRDQSFIPRQAHSIREETSKNGLTESVRPIFGSWLCIPSVFRPSIDGMSLHV